MPIISAVGGMSSRGFGQIIGAAGGEKFFVSDTSAPAYSPQGQPTNVKLQDDKLLISLINYDSGGTSQIAFAREFTSGDSAVFQPSVSMQRAETSYQAYTRTCAKDSSGNFWVGYISTGATKAISLLKFDSSGTFVASYRYQLTSYSNLDDLSSFQMVITNDDTIYISFIHTRWYYCGGCPTYESYPAIFIRYSNGTTYGAVANLYAPQQYQRSSIWTDGTNVVTAYSNGSRWASVRWSASGTSILSGWASDNASASSQYYNANCCDPSGNMYFTFIRSFNLYIVKVNATGSTLGWSFVVSTIPSPYYGAENGSIDYGNDGYLYVSVPFRNSDDSGSLNTLLILKMTTSGTIVWQRTLKISMSGVGAGGSAGLAGSFIVADKKNSFYIVNSYSGNSGNTTGRYLIVCKFPKDGTKTGTYSTSTSGGAGTYVYSNSSFSGYNDGWPWTQYTVSWQGNLTVSASTPSTTTVTPATIGSPRVKYIS